MYGMPFYSSRTVETTVEEDSILQVGIPRSILSSLIFNSSKRFLNRRPLKLYLQNLLWARFPPWQKWQQSSLFNPTRMSLCMHVDLKLLTRIRCIDPHPMPEMQSTNPILFTTKRYKTKIMVQYMWNTELIPYCNFGI